MDLTILAFYLLVKEPNLNYSHENSLETILYDNDSREQREICSKGKLPRCSRRDNI